MNKEEIIKELWEFSLSGVPPKEVWRYKQKEYLESKINELLVSQRKEIIERVEMEEYGVSQEHRERNQTDAYIDGYNKALKEIINLIKEDE